MRNDAGSRAIPEGQSSKSINNHLGVLSKLLNVAAEWGMLVYTPRIKRLKEPPSDFDFLGRKVEERPYQIAVLEKRLKFNPALEVFPSAIGLRTKPGKLGVGLGMLHDTDTGWRILAGNNDYV